MKSPGLTAARIWPLILLAGCAGTRGTVGVAPTARTPTPAVTPVAGSLKAVVFCADGAGGFGATTEALRDNLGANSPIRVELVDWSHGRGLMFTDHLHHRNIVDQATRLANRVKGLRAGRPQVPVYLVGHSAGCAVVLAAAEQLGPSSLERIVLLAPSVSSGYDLRPALTNSRLGVVSFASKHDWWVLGFGMRLFGTTDRRWSYTSGRYGFERVGNGPSDAALYAKLRQVFWDPSQAKTGHKGGHFGSFEDGYLRAYIIPLLTPPPLPPPTEGPDLGGPQLAAKAVEGVTRPIRPDR